MGTRLGDDYLAVNRANWDARAVVHAGPGGYELDAFDDPGHLSDVVRFDLPRLGNVSGLDGVHLQCHIGTDTLSLHRLGARMTGVDLSGESLAHARDLARAHAADIDYVQADVYSAPEALAGRQFDLVYTGVGALCWLPDIVGWAQVVAQLLRPGGRLFVRDGHPVLNSLVGLTVRDHHPDRDQQPWISGPGEAAPALEFPYWERRDPMVWSEEEATPETAWWRTRRVGSGTTPSVRSSWLCSAPAWSSSCWPSMTPCPGTHFPA